MKKVILCALSVFSAFECTAMDSGYKDPCPIFAQVVRGQIEALRNIEPSDLEQIDSEGQTLLFYIIASDDVDCLKEIFPKIMEYRDEVANEIRRSPLRVRDRFFRSTIHIAVDKRSMKSLRWLLRDENDTDNEEEKEQIRIIREEIGINAQDTDGMTPFIYAAANGDLEMMKFLVDKEVISVATDYKGDNVLHHLARSNSPATIEAIEWVLSEDFQAKMFMQREKYPYDAALRLVRSGNALRHQLYYEFRDDDAADLMHSHNTLGERPIDIAAAAGNWAVVDMLWDESLRLVPYDDSRNIRALGSLIVSLFQAGNLRYFQRIIEIVKSDFTDDPDLLISKLANSSAKHGLTAIRAAISSGIMECVDILLANGAILSDDDLSIIIREGHTEMLQFLFECGAFQVNSSCMLAAINAGDKELINLFISWLKDEEVLDAEPILEACKCCGLDIVRPLVEHCHENLTDVAIAYAINHPDLVRYLIETCGIELRGETFIKILGDAVRSQLDVTESLGYLFEHCSLPEGIDLLPAINPSKIDNVNFKFLIDEKHIPVCPSSISSAIALASPTLLSYFIANGAIVTSADVVKAATLDFASFSKVRRAYDGPVPSQAITQAIGAKAFETAISLIYNTSIPIPENTLRLLLRCPHIINLIEQYGAIKRICAAATVGPNLNGDILAALVRLGVDFARGDRLRASKRNPYLNWIALVAERLPVAARVSGLNFAIERGDFPYIDFLLKDMTANELGTAAFESMIYRLSHGHSSFGASSEELRIVTSMIEHGAVISLKHFKFLLDIIIEASPNRLGSLIDIAKRVAPVVSNVSAHTLKQAITIGNIDIINSVIEKIRFNELAVIYAIPEVLKLASEKGIDSSIVDTILLRLPRVTQEIIDAASGRVRREMLMLLQFKFDEQRQREEGTTGKKRGRLIRH